jgi:hypothetical protein
METTRSCIFTKTVLAPSEELAGFNLPVLTRAVLHNLRVDIAEQRLALDLDTRNVTAFVQAEAELKGQLGILNYILNRCEDILIEKEVKQQQQNEG